MVADINTGNLTRSLVRVPGSGRDLAAGSECMDLSRVSTLAATVPVSTRLPRVLNGPRNFQSQQQQGNKKPQASISSQQNQNKKPQAPISSQQNQNKKPQAPISSQQNQNKKPHAPISSQQNQNKKPQAPISSQQNQNKKPQAPISSQQNRSQGKIKPGGTMTGINLNSHQKPTAIVAPNQAPKSTVPSRKRPLSEVNEGSHVDNPSYPTTFANTSGTSNHPAATGGPPRSKKPRIVYMTPEQIAQQAKNMITVQTSSGVLLLLPIPSNNSNNASSPPPPQVTETSLKDVVQESLNLKKENLALQQKISLFKQLFQNKERLTSVVKRLGVNVVSQ